MTATQHLTVVEVDGDRIFCHGAFPVAACKGAVGTHSALRPVLLIPEIQASAPIVKGDAILQHPDGSYEHQPRKP